MARQGLFSSIGHAAVIVAAGALALTAVEPSRVLAASKRPSAASTTANATDFSTRRLYRDHRRGASAAFAAMAGTGVAIAASRNRSAYDDADSRCSPVYCGPYYYGSARYNAGSGSGTPIFPGW